MWPPWSKSNEKALASYVLADVADRLRLAKARDEVLKRDGRKKLIELTYKALADRKLRYAREKYDPENEVQLIREPNLILDGCGEATCLDLALLFAGACLGNRLLPMVVIVSGHAFVTVSLTRDREEADSPVRYQEEGEWVNDGLLKDAETLENLVDAGYWVAIECTGFVRSIDLLSESFPEGKGRNKRNGLMSFKRACEAGREQFSKRKFEFAIDIAVLQDLRKNPRYERYEPLSQQQAPAPATPPVLSQPQPEPYVERPELTGPLITRLLELRHTPGTIEMSVIHGMGGLGKSLIATWLAWQPLVAKRFPHGRLWTTLGRDTRQPLLILNDWIHRLGRTDLNPITLEGARTELATLLQDRAVLFIIDDVWPESPLDEILFPAPRCQFLITTRFPTLVKQSHAQFFPVDEMTGDQSRELLALTLKRQLAEHEKPLADRLATTVGNHPLALELAAARINEGLRTMNQATGQVKVWSDLIYQLSAEVARLEALEEEQAFLSESTETRRKRLSVRASLLLSIRYLTQEYQHAFACLGVLAEDADVTPALASTLWSVDETKAGKRLAALAGMSLLTQGHNCYSLHDLLHDIARELLTSSITTGREGELPGLGLTIEDASNQLVQAYQRKTTENNWHMLKDDGYVFDHLVYHMAKARNIDALRSLLGKPWLELQERRTGSFASFATELDVAISLVAETEGKNFIDLFRWSYARAILASRATGLPPDLLGALVYLGDEETRQAREYATLIAESSRRASAYLSMTKAAFIRDEHKLAGDFLNSAWAALVAMETSGSSLDLICEFTMSSIKLGDSKLIEYAATKLDSEAEDYIKSPNKYADVLRMINALKSLGHSKLAEQLVRSAAKDLSNEKHPFGEDLPRLVRLRTSLRTVGMDDEAERMNAQIAESFAGLAAAAGKSWCRTKSELIEAFSEAGDFDKALTIAHSGELNEFTWDTPGALASLANAMLSRQPERAPRLLNMALALAREHLEEYIGEDDLNEREESLVSIAKVLVRLEQTRTAIDFARRVNPLQTRAAMLASIVAVLAETGRFKEASTVANECLQLAHMGSHSEHAEALALARIAQSLASLQETTRARQAIQLSHSLLGDETYGNWESDKARTGLAQASAVLGDMNDSDAVLSNLRKKWSGQRAMIEEIEIADALVCHGSKAAALSMVNKIMRRNIIKAIRKPGLHSVESPPKASRTKLLSARPPGSVSDYRRIDYLRIVVVLARAASLLARLGLPDRGLLCAHEAVSLINSRKRLHPVDNSYSIALGHAAGTIAAYESKGKAMQIILRADRLTKNRTVVLKLIVEIVHVLWKLEKADCALEVAQMLFELEPSARLLLAEALERAGAQTRAQEEARHVLRNLWPPREDVVLLLWESNARL